MPIYMNFNDLAIKGGVTADGYKDWIEIDSFQFGVGRAINMTVGHMTDREASIPSISEISLSKMLDSASCLLLQESLIGVDGVKVLIHLVQTGPDKVEKYSSYELDDTLISSFSVSAGGGAKPMESLSLSFSKMLVDMQGADKTNKNGTDVKVNYDLTTAKK
jgi:type VI secretion system secreted protein Hcp